MGIVKMTTDEKRTRWIWVSCSDQDLNLPRNVLETILGIRCINVIRSAGGVLFESLPSRIDDLCDQVDLLIKAKGCTGLLLSGHDRCGYFKHKVLPTLEPTPDQHVSEIEHGRSVIETLIPIVQKRFPDLYCAGFYFETQKALTGIKAIQPFTPDFWENIGVNTEHLN